MPTANSRPFSVGNVRVGSGSLVLIAGPCVIESETHCRRMAEQIQLICTRLNLPLIFKASFDKANRTAIASYRGPGLREGLSILKSIREELSLPVLTDIHDVSQVRSAAEAVDCLQIPAFLSRQTDLLVAAGKSGCAVNIKKGQFLAPWDMRHAAAKVASTGCDRILLTERGTSFGYNNLVVDMRALPLMRKLGYPVVYDVTHSLQLPGGQDVRSGGQPEFIEYLARAGVAVGVDAIFMEVHDQPEEALSDGPSSLHLSHLESLLRLLIGIDDIIRGETRKGD